MRLESKILTLLGFASKSNKLSFGFASSSETLKKQKSKLIVVGFDISEKSKKEIRFLAKKNGVNVIVLQNTDTNTLSHAVGRNCGIISVNDDSFASAIAENYGRKC